MPQFKAAQQDRVRRVSGAGQEAGSGGSAGSGVWPGWMDM